MTQPRMRSQPSLVPTSTTHQVKAAQQSHDLLPWESGLKIGHYITLLIKINLMVAEQSPMTPAHIVKTTIGKLAPFNLGSNRLGSKRRCKLNLWLFLSSDRQTGVASRGEFVGQITSFSWHPGRQCGTEACWEIDSTLVSDSSWHLHLW